jgi:hypothetical protein
MSEFDRESAMGGANPSLYRLLFRPLKRSLSRPVLPSFFLPLLFLDTLSDFLANSYWRCKEDTEQKSVFLGP